MAIPLEKQFPVWSELCEHCLSKIKQGIKNEADAKKFRRWFMKREHLGWCFDHFLVYKAYSIWKELEKGFDHFTVLTGREGTGKSTLAMQLAAWVVPSYNLDGLVDNSEDYNRILEARAIETVKLKLENKKPERMALIMDEGTELLSRESMKKSNVSFLKTFLTQRRLNMFIVICIPNFYFLDASIRQHRVRSLLHIYQRGRYKYFSTKAIPIVADAGAKHKQVLKVKLPDDQFQYGDFRKDIPKSLDWDAYDNWKLSRIVSLLKKPENGK